VGNLEWLKKNYDFSKISYSIDELVVLDVSRGNRSFVDFCSALKMLTDGCFVPIAAGGGVDKLETAQMLLRSGADKIVINSGLYLKNGFVDDLAREFGQQCVVGSMDIKRSANGEYQAWSENGTKCEEGAAEYWITKNLNESVGEIYLNSMDRDGTGQGFDLESLNLLPSQVSKPVILAGGAGNAMHLSAGLQDSRVDAVATANLFNFVGNGLKEARETLVSSGIVLPMWESQVLDRELRFPRNHGGILD
jgi:cyclase